MEGFLLGDKGPEVFYEVQEEVIKTLEEKFYPSFLVCDLYQKMQTAMEEASNSERDESGIFPLKCVHHNKLLHVFMANAIPNFFVSA
jgi:hypothetical protein